MMGLKDVGNRLVRTYSGGMIRRLEIAQCTLHRPRLIFMDEPTIGLDPTGRHLVWQHVRALRDRLGTAILLTTHQMEEADTLCDRIGVLCAGRLVAIGSPRELKQRVGAQATLDDVFEALTGTALAARGDYDLAREERRGVREHG
jgi:ABC-2 type transport system ATP-binding protein